MVIGLLSGLFVLQSAFPVFFFFFFFSCFVQCPPQSEVTTAACCQILDHMGYLVGKFSVRVQMLSASGYTAEKLNW